MDEQCKKRRRLLPQPDGFLPTKKTQQRLPAPKFQSAFDSPTSSSASSSKKPPNSASRFQPLPTPQFKASTPAPDTKQHVAMRRQPIPVPPSHPDPQHMQSPIPRKHQEPPALPNLQSLAGRPPKPVKPLSSTRTLVTSKPPPAVLPLKPLRERVPLAPDSPVTPGAGERKPLSTTYPVALMGVSSDSDSVELSSILLQFQDHKSTTGADVLVSPQKSKHIRFVHSFLPVARFFLNSRRGGLATRASHLYSQSHTSHYLWRTCTKSQSVRQPASDISFHVCKILHTVSSGVHRPCLSITLCRVHAPVRPFCSRRQLVYVVVRYPDAPRSSPLCDPCGLKEGCMLHIWRPWHEVALVNSVSDSVALLSASLPVPSSSNDSISTANDENIHDIVLLCSRFLIIQDT